MASAALALSTTSALGLPQGSSSKPAVLPTEIEIGWASEVATRDGKWDSACEVLGSHLQEEEGPWGLGPFTKYSCHAPAEHKRDAWLLQVHFDGKILSFTLSLPGKTDAVAKLRLAGVTQPFDVLADAEFATLLAAEISRQMPMIGRLTAVNSAEAGWIVTNQTASSLARVPVPRHLLLMNLTFDSGEQLWRSKVITTAELAADTDTSELRWRLARSPTPDETKAGILLACGPDCALDGAALRTQLGAAATSAQSAAAQRRNAWSVTRDGLIGLRYAHSFEVGPLVSNMSVVSLQLALPGPLADGLRLQYDWWPKVVSAEPTGAQSLQGDRVSAGWTFGFTPAAWLGRIELIPKIGLLAMQVKFGFLDTSGVARESTFSAKNSLSPGLEVGLEQTYGLILGRAWLAHDAAYDEILQRNGTAVVSDRAGLDLALRLPAWAAATWSRHLAVLLFAYAEHLRCDKSGPPPAAPEVRSVAILATYAGTGLGLSW